MLRENLTEKALNLPPDREKQILIGFQATLVMDQPVLSVLAYNMQFKIKMFALRKKYPGLTRIEILDKSGNEKDGIATAEIIICGHDIHLALFKHLLSSEVFRGLNDQISYVDIRAIRGDTNDSRLTY